jgi:hypothetical protein
MKITIGKCVQVLALLFAFNSLLLAQENASLIEFWDDREPDSKMSVDHQIWQSLLDAYIDDSHPSGIHRFDYENVSRSDRERLRAYLDHLQSYEPRQFNESEQKAYWVNLYNAATVSLVLQNISSIDSIRELRSGVFIPGPWKRKLVEVAGQNLSLDEIEHGILRPIFNDPRIHYGLNHASLGCPNLSNTAFTGDSVDDQLDAAAMQFIGHSRAVRIEAGQLFLSSIYDWYQSDFGGDLTEQLAHIARYVDSNSAAQLENFTSAEYSFNWLLNKP